MPGDLIVPIPQTREECYNQFNTQRSLSEICLSMLNACFGFAKRRCPKKKTSTLVGGSHLMMLPVLWWASSVCIGISDLVINFFHGGGQNHVFSDHWCLRRAWQIEDTKGILSLCRRRCRCHCSRCFGMQEVLKTPGAGYCQDGQAE